MILKNDSLVADLLDIANPQVWLGQKYDSLRKSVIYVVQLRAENCIYVRETDTFFKPVYQSRENLAQFELGIDANGNVAAGKDSQELLLESFYEKLPRAPWGARKAVNGYFKST